MSRTLVIGEPGCTAEGSMDAMLRLFAVARDAGCDVWKPQFCSNPARMCERRNIGPNHPKRAYYERAYSWLQWSEVDLAEFRIHCNNYNVQLALSVYLPEDVPIAAEYADILKIASFEANDAELVAAARKAKRRLVVSLGMCEGNGPPKHLRRPPQPELLQCVTSYPAPLKSTELGLLKWWRDRDGMPWLSGLSDHSRDLDMGMMAVCAGAQIIETHFRLYDCNPENPDYPVAFDLGELAMYIGKIRKAERAMGSGIKKIQESEKWALPYRVSA